MTIVLSSGECVVKRIKRKTTARLFKDVVVGDVITLTMDASPSGGNRGNTYASYFKVTLLRTGEETYLSHNQLRIMYDVLEF